MPRSDRRMHPTPGHTALVVIDMQNAFCRDGGSFARLGFDISMLKAAIAPCQRLVARLTKPAPPTVTPPAEVPETANLDGGTVAGDGDGVSHRHRPERHAER